MYYQGVLVKIHQLLYKLGNLRHNNRDVYISYNTEGPNQCDIDDDEYKR